MVSLDQPCRPVMPLKLNTNRPLRFRARYRIRNWPQYEAGLKRRGDLTLWLDEAAIAGWQAPRRTTPGGQALYSDLAIELVLALRLVFHLALRQALSRSRAQARRVAHRLMSGWDTGRVSPCLKRLSSEEAVSASRDEVTRNGEDVVGGRVQGQEPLG